MSQYSGQRSLAGDSPRGREESGMTEHAHTNFQTKRNYLDSSKTVLRDFPSGPVVKNPPCNAGDMGSSVVWELRFHVPWSN